MGAYRNPRRAGENAPPRPCEYCKTVFVPHYASVGRFCSARCGYDWRIAQNILRMAAVCAACGNDFVKKKKRDRFCSVRCAATSWTEPRSVDEPPPVEGARWLALSKGKFTLVDEADFARVSDRPWSYSFNHGADEVTHSRRDGTPRILSRFIMSATDNVTIDHRDGNRLDNRRFNLREASNQQNLRNRHKSKSASTSSFKGVYFSRKADRWCAMIKFDRKGRHLGSFLSEEDAAHAYDTAAREHFGTFACVNFPLPGERSAIE